MELPLFERAGFLLKQSLQQGSTDQERQQSDRERLTLLTDEDFELSDHDGLLGMCRAYDMAPRYGVSS